MSKRIYATRELAFGDFIQLYFVDEKDGKRYLIQTNPELVEHTEFTMPAPSIVLTSKDYSGPSEAQQLMDGLWALGVRPSDIGTPGHLAATQAHLEDFRAITAKMLQIELPTRK